MKMIRRVVGISHVEDLDGITDRAIRSRCEGHALALGKRLAMASEAVAGVLMEVENVCAVARSLSGPFAAPET